MSPLSRILLCVLASPALLYATHLVVARLFRKGSRQTALTWLIILMQSAVLALVWAVVAALTIWITPLSPSPVIS